MVGQSEEVLPKGLVVGVQTVSTILLFPRPREEAPCTNTVGCALFSLVDVPGHSCPATLLC